MNRRLLTACTAATLLIATLLPAASAAGPRLERPPVQRSTEVAPIKMLDRSLVGGQGRVDVVVRLVTEPVATVRGAERQKARGTAVTREQDAILAKLAGLDANSRLLARTKVALNAVIVNADSADLAALAADQRVASITRVRDYQLDLQETVPHIGATELHETGLTGDGIVVAVLDSGVDYTHAAFGGPGNVDAYLAAYGTKTKHQKNQKTNDRYKGRLLYPTAKVIGGFDFVGEGWTGAAGSPPLAPDPDPIDCSPAAIGCDGGHGTHVADIIAGEDGVAPDADILAYKVCSSVSTSCSGVAMLQGIDAAADPNGDGVTNDHADIINMSIGSTYGQSDDDSISQAVEGATVAGVLTVASAGNSGDKPYVTGTPAAAPTALSVAQTAVPSSQGFALLVSTDGGVTFVPREAVHQSWSHELTAEFAVTNVPVQYGDGGGGNLDGCAAFAANSLTGKVVLVDRGACDFTLKISNIAGGGGKIGVIGHVAPGDPFDGALGACPDNLCTQIPGYQVSQSTSTAMKGANARVTFDPDNGIPLVLHMVGSSSRGPDNDNHLIKPEIGAPGASVSAEVGTGDGTTSFGGTSGAAPMVAGAAALLMEADGARPPLEVKASLINTGYTEIMNRPVEFGGELAPITRIGGGEVRVNRAHASQAAAWDADAPTAALNFGFHDVTANHSVERSVTVRNYGSTPVTYNLSSTFRFANDEANGAVAVSSSVPSVTVNPFSSASFDVTLAITASALRTWTLDSGINGASASQLQLLEYDGYLWLDAAGDADDIHLPWQVLPRKSSAVTASATSVAPGGTVTLTNAGAGRSWVGSYSLIGTSPNDAGTLGGDDLADVDLRYVGVRQFLGADAIDVLGCEAGYGVEFAVNTWERQVHANAPALFEFDLDLDRDGTFDFAVFNFDASNSGALSDGRNFTWALDLSDPDAVATAFFPTIHPTDSGTSALTVCGEQIGLEAGDAGDEIDVVVLAADWYNSGLVTDVVETSIVVGGDRYTTDLEQAPFGPAFGGTIGGGSAARVTITDHGAAGTNPTETGVLFTTDETLTGILAFGQSGGATQATEAIAVQVTAP
jgi:subtilisin family serine protease